MKLNKKQIGVITVVAIPVAAVIWVAWGNITIATREITVMGAGLPENFSGMRIAHLSDFHNADFGNGNQKLIDLLAASQVDIIVITGDFIDSRHTDIGISLDFAKKIAKIAPVYYATGNHESRIADYGKLEAGLVECGVTVLRNSAATLELDDQIIQLVGVDDPAFVTKGQRENRDAIVVNRALKKLVNDSSPYTILLSHRPELFNVYCSNGLDLVFSGHAHGGQFRVPFVGGLFSPNQGLFPVYDSGLYTKGDTNMIVSRGIGGSVIPLRINNRPEVVFVTLMKG